MLSSIRQLAIVAKVYKSFKYDCAVVPHTAIPTQVAVAVAITTYLHMQSHSIIYLQQLTT